MRQAQDAFYTSARWRKLREWALRRDGYRCQYAKRFGRSVQASAVHHVLPREDFPEFQWEPWNLISLSAEAHDKMHDRQTGRLTEEGRAMARRVLSGRRIELTGCGGERMTIEQLLHAITPPPDRDPAAGDFTGGGPSF